MPPPGAVISAWISACDSARSWIWKSSTSACRSGSPYCERPIQLLVVLPMLDGLSVTLALVATWLPSTHTVTVVPERVTAT